jgi:hypothetical protein
MMPYANATNKSKRRKSKDLGLMLNLLPRPRIFLSKIMFFFVPIYHKVFRLTMNLEPFPHNAIDIINIP